MPDGRCIVWSLSMALVESKWNTGIVHDSLVSLHDHILGKRHPELGWNLFNYFFPKILPSSLQWAFHFSLGHIPVSCQQLINIREMTDFDWFKVACSTLINYAWWPPGRAYQTKKIKNWGVISVQQHQLTSRSWCIRILYLLHKS